MKVWIDILTPKQLRFLGKLSDRLERDGHTVYKTTRHYRELNYLMRIEGIEAKRVGVHGGKPLLNKLRSSLLRTLQLSKIIAQIDVSISISFSSVEAARVSYGLGIPHLCISDSPHAEAVSKLTIPLSKLLYTPHIIPKNVWARYGIARKHVIHYNALDPAAWIRGYKFNPNLIDELGLTPNIERITIRPEEVYAAYLPHTTLEGSVTMRMVDHLLAALNEVEIVIVPRYREQYKLFQRKYRRKLKVKVLKKPVDTLSLLSSSSCFIGGGGTMTAEAALMGIPTISCYPSKPTYVERYLIKKGLVVRSLNPRKVVRQIRDYLKDEELKDRLKLKAEGLLNSMDDPIDAIARGVETFTP